MTKDVVKFIEYKGHWPDLEVKDFVIPTVEFAQKFSKMSKPTLQKISDNKKQIQTLTQTRDTLLPRLMSGEVEV
jgi:type I restriction enzyme S subunit